MILFHIDSTLLPGGFLGVDIFFVISGYLISLQIMQNVEKGTFSLSDFYRRRIKRIIPLLLVIIFTGLLFAQLFFLPGDAQETALSAFWALFSLANVYFWLTEDSGYFAASSEEQPFLHLWSLGIEEQFYILWPFILLLILRKDKGRLFLPVILSTILLSFLSGEVAYRWDPSFVYYMLPSRIGELLIGAFIAYLVFRNITVTRRLSALTLSFLSAISFLIICSSFFLISEEDVFPGLRAIPPTVCTGAFILLGHRSENRIKGALSISFLVRIGKLSYSAYLWHWLLLAFYRYFFPALTPLHAGVIVMITFLLSYLTYTYVETPFRRTDLDFMKVFNQYFLIPSTLLSGIIFFSLITNGYGFRGDRDTFLSPMEMNNRIFVKHPFSYDYICMPEPISEEDLTDSRCVLGNEPEDEEPTRVLLWGDSNSTHFIGTIGALAEAENVSFRNISVGACPPILSDPAPFVSANWLDNCADSKPLIQEHISDYEVLILSASWPGYFGRSDTFKQELRSTLTEVTGRDRKVILIGKAPVLNNYDPLCHKKKIRFPWLSCENQSYDISEGIIRVNRELQTLSGDLEHVYYYDFNEYICPGGTCYAYDEKGIPLYRDKFHIDIEASWKIGRDILTKEGVPHPFSQMSEWVNNPAE